MAEDVVLDLEDNFHRLNEIELDLNRKFTLELSKEHDFEITLEKANHGKNGRIAEFFAPPGEMSEESQEQLNFNEPLHIKKYKEGLTFNISIYHKKKDKRFYIMAGTVPENLRQTSEIHRADVIYAAVKNLSGARNASFINWFNDVVASKTAPTVVPIHWDSFFKKLNTNCSTNDFCLKTPAFLKMHLNNLEKLVTKIDERQYKIMDSFEVAQF